MYHTAGRRLALVRQPQCPPAVRQGSPVRPEAPGALAAAVLATVPVAMSARAKGSSGHHIDRKNVLKQGSGPRIEDKMALVVPSVHVLAPEAS